MVVVDYQWRGEVGAIIWDPALETNDDKIDSQHKELFSIINDLHSACVEGDTKSCIQAVLRRLADYVNMHFADEEVLMMQCSYPPVPCMDHMAAHRKLREDALDLIGKYDRGEVATVLPLTGFLMEWLRSHIREMDAALVTHARAHGFAGA